MSRSRAALLDGARRAVEVSGTKITMSQVATAAGVAKATLYNHFRTRDAVLAALLDHEVDELLRHAGGRPLDEALRLTADALSRAPGPSALARREPATVVRLARIDDMAPRAGIECGARSRNYSARPIEVEQVPCCAGWPRCW